MFKKIILLYIVLFSVTGCLENKNELEKETVSNQINELNKLCNQIVNTQDLYIETVKKTKNSKEFINAYIKYNKDMKKINQRLVLISKEFSSIQNKPKEAHEISDIFIKIQKLMVSFKDKNEEIMPVLTIFMKDEDVQQVLKKYQNNNDI